MEALEDRTDSVRSWSARALGEIGSGAKATIPALIKAMKNTTEAQGLNPHHARKSIVESLGKIAPESEEVVFALIDALQDESYVVRCSAAYELTVLKRKTRL
ncbi:hypothetical protein NDI44_13330 [Trichocoleus sp. DQ-A3]